MRKPTKGGIHRIHGPTADEGEEWTEPGFGTTSAFELPLAGRRPEHRPPLLGNRIPAAIREDRGRHRYSLREPRVQRQDAHADHGPRESRVQGQMTGSSWNYVGVFRKFRGPLAIYGKQ